MLKSIHIENFKSIQKLDLHLEPLNILIGPNGAGKSNFISLFKLLEKLMNGQLTDHIFQSGGINALLFNGFEKSGYFRSGLELGYDDNVSNTFSFQIASDGERHFFQSEKVGFWNKAQYPKPTENEIHINNNGKSEAIISKWKEFRSRLSPESIRIVSYVERYLETLKVFHFHDTSDNAQMKLPQSIDDVYFFKNEAENLAPFLMHLQAHHYDVYYQIVETVRLIYPQFHDFELEESPFAKGKVVLRWRESSSGQIFHARQISDGTLRFICLASLLLQPKGTNYVPPTILLDEPELGLHPFAIHILADLIHKAAQNRQVIIATQSVSLINYFTPNDLIVVERNGNGASIFSRKKDEDFEQWLEDYSLGQLWENNFLGGRP
jgi:predicted ATPase